MTMTERQQLCETTAKWEGRAPGHCLHQYSDPSGVFDVCCACGWRNTIIPLSAEQTRLEFGDA